MKAKNARAEARKDGSHAAEVVRTSYIVVVALQSLGIPLLDVGPAAFDRLNVDLRRHTSLFSVTYLPKGVKRMNFVTIHVP